LRGQNKKLKKLGGKILFYFLKNFYFGKKNLGLGGGPGPPLAPM